MPRIHGIVETALHVSDVPRAAEFYRRLFQFDTLLQSERLVALEVAGRNVLLLFKAGATAAPLPTSGGIIPGHAGGGIGHLAFAIARDDLQSWQQRLEAAGIPLESTVHWEGGGTSLYFRDPDQHLVELLTPGLWRTY